MVKNGFMGERCGLWTKPFSCPELIEFDRKDTNINPAGRIIMTDMVDSPPPHKARPTLVPGTFVETKISDEPSHVPYRHP